MGFEELRAMPRSIRAPYPGAAADIFEPPFIEITMALIKFDFTRKVFPISRQGMAEKTVFQGMKTLRTALFLKVASLFLTFRGDYRKHAVKCSVLAVMTAMHVFAYKLYLLITH